MRYTYKTNSNYFSTVPKSSWENLSPNSTQLGSTTDSEETSTSEKSSSRSICLVKWVDAATHGGPGWVALEDAEEFAQSPPPVMTTIGWLVYKTEEEGPDGWVAVTDTIGDDETASVHKIPNPMIITMEVLPYEAL